MASFDAFSRGDIVRVPFPYADRPVRQQRPALVVSNGAVGENGALLWVVMITSADNRPWPGDLALGESYLASGLPAPSIVRPAKIATIEALHAVKLGRLSAGLLAEVTQAIIDRVSPAA